MKRLKNIFLFQLALASLTAANCDFSFSNNEEEPTNKNEEPTDGAYTIDDWQDLGYAVKPTKYIALTFDDGPVSTKAGDFNDTEDLLKILKDKKVQATFFLIGQNIRSSKAAAEAIFNAGHEIANHSDGYSSLGGATDEDTIRTSLTKASEEIKAITGTDPVLFRAPNVNYGTNLTAVCTELGLAIIGVNVWSHDYNAANNAEQCLNNVLNAAQDGGIINCHEANTSGDRTLPILAEMIDGLRERGYWITTVSGLAKAKGKTLEAGVQYDSIK